MGHKIPICLRSRRNFSSRPFPARLLPSRISSQWMHTSLALAQLRSTFFLGRMTIIEGGGLWATWDLNARRTHQWYASGTPMKSPRGAAHRVNFASPPSRRCTAALLVSFRQCRVPSNTALLLMGSNVQKPTAARPSRTDRSAPTQRGRSSVSPRIDISAVRRATSA